MDETTNSSEKESCGLLCILGSLRWIVTAAPFYLGDFFGLAVFVYITLHYITLHYITLHYITLHYITLHAVLSL
jgi:hypothetical protein